MRDLKRFSVSPALDLISTLLRAWLVGFALAARGTVWVVRKTFRLLPFRRSTGAQESLID
jgi:hypothetical protein